MDFPLSLICPTAFKSLQFGCSVKKTAIFHSAKSQYTTSCTKHG